MIDPVTLGSVAVAYEIAKYWIPIIAAMFGLFKVINWVKTSFIDIKDKVHSLNTNITGLITKVEEQTTAVVKKTEEQTHAVVGEVKELRGDFRTFYVPALLTQNQLTGKPSRVGQRAKKKPALKAKRKVK